MIVFVYCFDVCGFVDCAMVDGCCVVGFDFVVCARWRVLLWVGSSFVGLLCLGVWHAFGLVVDLISLLLDCVFVSVFG